MSSFPNIIYGDYGDEKKTSSTKIGGNALGTLMVLPDGRLFRHARAGTLAVVVGKLYDGPAATADHGCGTADNLVVTAGALAATAVSLSAGGTTAITKDQYADGYLTIHDDTGEGYVYKIKGNNSCAVSVTTQIHLANNETVIVAAATGTTTASLRKNEYDGTVLKTADTVSVAPIAGVPAASCAASTYHWVQRRGPVALLTDGTLIIGRPVVASTVNQAGGVSPAPADSTGITNAGHVDILGEVLVVAASTEYSLINLRLE